MKNQIFSIMKGIAIISVVTGHCAYNYNGVEPFVNQYHLAVFFFTAGYFFKRGTYKNNYAFIKKRIRALYIPFVVSGLIFLCLHNILKSLYIYGDNLSFNDIIKSTFQLCIELTSNDAMMGAMWFCPTLLWVSIFSMMTFAISTKMTGGGSFTNMLSFIVIVITADICLHTLHLKSPYCIWQNLIICGIFFEGHFFRIHIEPLIKGKNKWLYILTSIFLAFIIWQFTQYGLMARLQPKNINEENTCAILFIAFIGSIMVYTLSQVLNENKTGKIVAFAGNHSFSIMLLHFFCFKLVNMIQCYIYHYPLEKILSFPIIEYNTPIWLLAYIITGTFLPAFFAVCFNKFKKIFYVRYNNRGL